MLPATPSSPPRKEILRNTRTFSAPRQHLQAALVFLFCEYSKAEERNSTTEVSLSSFEANISPSWGTSSPTEDRLPLVEEKNSTPEEGLSSFEANISLPWGTSSPTEDRLPLVEEKNSTSEEGLSSFEVNISLPWGTSSLTEDSFFISK
jgi:hypothetical protein